MRKCAREKVLKKIDMAFIPTKYLRAIFYFVGVRWFLFFLGVRCVGALVALSFLYVRELESKLACENFSFWARGVFVSDKEKNFSGT